MVRRDDEEEGGSGGVEMQIVTSERTDDCDGRQDDGRGECLVMQAIAGRQRELIPRSLTVNNNREPGQGKTVAASTP